MLTRLQNYSHKSNLFYWINATTTVIKKTQQQPSLLYEILVLHIPLWSLLHSECCQCHSLCTKRDKETE